MADAVLIAALLLLLAVVVAGVFRRLPLPDSVVLVITGMALGELARDWAPAEHIVQLQLSPELVFFVLLPVLVFESALNLDVRRLLKNLAPILTLAVPALVLSTAIVGLGLWLLTGLDPLIALLFGALISATDPVAVVALFKEVGAPARLTVLVEGESLFNDATAIVVFGLLLAIALDGGSLDAGALALAVPDFLVVFLGGTALGAGIGALASELAWRLRCPAPATVAVTIASAYVGFIVAEHGLHVSGVMAVVAAAVTFGALAVTRVGRDTGHVLHETWELLAFSCNSLLFLLVGLSVDIASLVRSWPLILVAVLLVHLARAVTVYPLVPLTTRLFSLPRIAMPERHIMWWGGLKGGLAIAIALSVPDSLPERQLVLDVTVGVVLFTLLVNASTLRPLMHRLGLDRMSDDERVELEEALAVARQRVVEALDGYREQRLLDVGAHHHLLDRLAHATVPGDGPRPAGHAQRAAHLSSLHAEASALAELYESRAIDQYTYLELRDILVHDRVTHEHASESPVADMNVFERMEAAVLRRLRERDWAAGLLSRYQDMRLRQHLQRNVGGIVMADAALAALAARADHDSGPVRGLRELYERRLSRRQTRLTELRGDFPLVYQRFETETFARSALVQALRASDRARDHGELGSKAYSGVTQQLDAALLAARPDASATPRQHPSVLIARVPLFHGLSDAALEAIAGQCRPVTFLPGDVIIGEGEHGDALYVISRGRVTVSRRDNDTTVTIAELGDGEIFGEAALLGESVRNATVTVDAPATVVRLRRRDVLTLTESWPEIGECLRSIDRERQAGD